MLQNILLPVDESPAFEAAFTTALALAEASSGEATIDALYILSVSKRTGRFLEDLSGMMGFEPVIVPEKVESWYRKQGEMLLSSVVERAHSRGVPARSVWDQGAVLERVANHASAADLVVAGVGEDGVVALSGQGECTADRFLKNCGTTALMVPAAQVNFSGICLGFDGSDGANAALRSTRRLAQWMSCPVHVVCVEDPHSGKTNDPLKVAETHLREAGVQVTTALLSGEPHEVLQSECQSRGLGLVAVGFRGRVGLPGRVLGRVTEALINESGTALLVSR